MMTPIRKIDRNLLKAFAQVPKKKNGLDLCTYLSLIPNRITAFSVDGKILDMRDNLDFLQGNEVVLPIYKEDKNSLDTIRHSMAHLMAQAVQRLYPQGKLCTGPTTENGFFYDFDLGEGKTLSSNDLKKIETLMKSIVLENIPIEKHFVSKEEAIKIMEKRGEKYKIEIIKNIDNDIVSLYSQGEFMDLCRGPHLYSTGAIDTNFSLTNVSGVSPNSIANHNEENTGQFQRIYGIGFLNQEDLQDYLNITKSSELLDHKKIGTQNNFFSFQPQYCSGGVFWDEKGFITYNEIVQYIRKIILNNGYFEVKTPILYNDELWKASGHWYHYKENMFCIPKEYESCKEKENREEKIPQAHVHYLSPKPMNCPAHIALFKSRNRSYKDLPMRMAEFGCCFRNEPSGSLDGLMRMREFTQDDAHIFCEFSQVKKETQNFCLLLKQVYNHFGFQDIEVIISTRPSKSFGTEENWEKAEQSLIEAMDSLNWGYTISHGDGAFYGPKLEFTLRDRVGRKWQCGTFQLDFVLPERMEAKFINSHSQEETPIICHRAILGSIERFLGILIENNGGTFPFWLSPMQIIILPISEKHNSYGEKILLMVQNIYRCQLDKSDQTLQKKLKNAIKQRIPLIMVIGQQEIDNETIVIRNIEGNTLTVKIDDLQEKLPNIIKDLLDQKINSLEK